MKSDSVLLSLIIPVYNVEKYLSTCLNSCLKQNFQNYEIICVNDGSTDKSSEILIEYSQRFPGLIKTLHTKNQGVSVARNQGIKISKGKYIWFIDPDDYISDNILYDISIYLNSIDILILPYYEITDNGDICNKQYGQCKNRVEIQTDYIEYVRSHPINRVWRYIVKKKLLTDSHLTFGKGIIRSEDRVFNYFLKFRVNNFAVYNKVAYFYRLSSISATRGYINNDEYKKRMIENNLAIVFYIKKNIIFLVDNESLNESLSYLSDWVRNIIIDSIKLGDVKYLKKNIRILKSEGLYPYPYIKKVSTTCISIKNNFVLFMSQNSLLAITACRCIWVFQRLCNRLLILI